MFDQAQLRKGTLEGCILKIIDREPTYGYAIATTLRDCGFADLTEGTLYPLLLRLERKGLIAAEYRAGSGGPSRKYYRLTPDVHCCDWMPITPAQPWNDKWGKEVQGDCLLLPPGVPPRSSEGQKEESDKIWR